MVKKFESLQGRFPLLILRKRGPINVVSVINAATDLEIFHLLFKRTFTSRAIKRIASRTRGQSTNSYWFLYRRGILTGTMAKRVIAQI